MQSQPPESSPEVRFQCLLDAVDREKQKLARRLHDTVAQNLAALSMNLSLLTTARDQGKQQDIVTECLNLVGQSITDVRSISYLLHPPLIEELGLRTAVQAMAASFHHDHRSQLDLQAPETTWTRLAPAREAALFRMIQEAASALARAGSDPVTVNVDPSPPFTVLVSGKPKSKLTEADLLRWILETRAQTCGCTLELRRNRAVASFEFVVRPETSNEL